MISYDMINESIRSISKQRRFLRNIVGTKIDEEPEPVEVDEDDECFDEDKPETFKSLFAKLDIAYGKLSECHTSVPEITERDIMMDHYWDKKEQQETAIKYGESLENRIRYQVLDAECCNILERIRKMVWADPELGERYEDARCDELDAQAHYEMYGDD